MTRSLALVLALLPVTASAETQVPASMAQVQLSYAPVVNQAAPAVVNIYATKMVARQSPFFDDPFFQQFFGTRDARPQQQNALGSGVIVGDGLVVSNFHVVDNATDIRVVLSDRREYEGEVVLADEQADLAVIRLPDAADLPSLDFADSDAVEVGDLVLAIGNPFGVGQTVSSGIVSGLARTGRGGGAYNAGGYFIQTDAPINPGNSGGALVDMQGRLVGINTQIVTRSGGSNGIGFAIPANLVKRVVAQADNGEASFTRPWAGVTVQPVDADIAEALGLDRPHGVMVQSVSDSSPFAEAGIEPGDVILTMAGQPVNAPGELGFRLSLQELGSMLDVTYLRDGQEQQASVEMRAASSAVEQMGGEPLTVTAHGPFEGLVVQELNPALADQLGLRSDVDGVIVLGAKQAVRNRHFQLGDVISRINGMDIRSMDDFIKASSEDRNSWKVLINRRGGRVYLNWRG
ncbi:MAG: Do family serine endopeptidase [Maritimibacter sp.]